VVLRHHSAGGWLGAEPPLLPRLDLDNWSVARLPLAGAGPRRAQPVPAQAGGAEVTAQGDVTDMAGVMQAQLDGKIGPMS